MIGKSEAKWLTVARLALGWLMFYAGITKILDPAWTSKGYLMGAKTFPGFYSWFISPENIGWVDFLNEWGLTLIGASLILGLGVRLSSVLGAALMLLYYFPVLEFPKVEHGFIIDDHIIYAVLLAFFAAVRAGRYYGLDNWCANLPICRRYPRTHRLWG